MWENAFDEQPISMCSLNYYSTAVFFPILIIQSAASGIKKNQLENFNTDRGGRFSCKHACKLYIYFECHTRLENGLIASRICKLIYLMMNLMYVCMFFIDYS